VPTAPPQTSRLQALLPCRLHDSRSTEPVPTVGTVTVRARGDCGIPTGATAVVVTVTAAGATGDGYGTVWPAGLPTPNASNINFAAGQTIANSTVVLLSPTGLSFFTSGPAHKLIDVVGYFEPARSAASGRFVPLSPSRIVDTRSGPMPGPSSVVAADASALLPPGASPAINVTFSDSLGPGHFTVYSSEPRPNASTGNADQRGQTRAIFTVAPAADIKIFTSAGAHVIVDVVGYFTGPSSAASTNGLFVPQAPTRVLDTRTGSPIEAGGMVRTGRLPGSGAWMNVTAVQPLAGGFIQATAGQAAKPNTSVVNYVAGRDVANSAIVALSSVGSDYYFSSPSHAVLDVLGVFTG
jgi:hypothetical protein